MLTLHNYEGKDIELLKKQIEKDYENLKIYCSNPITETSLFSKKFKISVLVQNELEKEIIEFINKLSELLNIDINVTIEYKDEILNVKLKSNNNSILIGNFGKTLNSIQVILRQAFKELNQFNLKILLDVENYREKKISRLKKEINKICNEVLLTNTEVKLDSMNSYERRIVHNIVSDYSNLISQSVGEEPNRCVVIKIKD